MQSGNSVRFALLGPLSVKSDGLEVTVPPKLRALLASLLVRSGEVISVDELSESIWGDGSPATAQVTLRSYVKRLRRALGPTAGSRVVTGSYGYAVTVADDELDLLCFQRLFRAGQDSVHRRMWPEASAALTEALALWRGPPMADVPSDLLQTSEAPRMEQLRLRALEWRIEADMQLGRTDDLLPELQDLVAVHPLNEHFYAQLMLVLNRCGRRAEALAAFRQARHVLHDELGVEPGGELQRLQQRVLAGDQDPVTAASPAPLARPRQLPATVRQFAGRTAELRILSDLIPDVSATGTTAVITAVDGTAGIGKTALALYWAHQVADKFPDGQIYINLRGFDPTGSPMRPGQAMRMLLDALGVPAERIPAEPDAQANLYRSLLVGRRLLIVLDNARDADQARMLLPASPSCLALVTSRTQLAGLAVDAGAQVLTLDALSATEATELLAQRLGRRRIEREPVAVAEIIWLCAALPLALSIAAALAAGNPSFPLSVLAADLRDVHGRLDTLDAGSATTSMRAVFSWSYQALSDPAARMFRLLGVHPGPDISLRAAASLAGIMVGDARALLTELTRAHLLTEHLPGRYTFHDLLRGYAVEAAGPDEDRDQAAGRMFDHYLHSGYTSALLLQPTREPLNLRSTRKGVEPEVYSSYDQALTWFRQEHSVLLGCVRLSREMTFRSHTWQLAWTMVTFFDRYCHWHDLAATQHVALAAAQEAGDRYGQAHSQRNLGRAYSRLRLPRLARRHLRFALRLYRRADDHAGQARTIVDLALVAEQRSEFGQALGYSRRALELFRAIGHRSGQADALNAVGWYCAQLGDYSQARASCGEALALHRDLGDRPGEAGTWDSLGYIHHQLGRAERAIQCYEHALALLEDLGDLYHQAAVLTNMGDALLAADRAGAARDVWQQALAILVDLQHPDADWLGAKLTAEGGDAG